MPTKRLTDKTLAATKAPKSGRLELWDSLLPGFGLRVTDKDARSWFIMYRANTPEGRKQRRLKIGDASAMGLGEAREAAREALRKVAKGVDPAAEVATARPLSAADTVQAVVADYLERYCKRHTRASTYKETKRIFAVDILPAWGPRSIGSITRGDVRAMADKIAARGAEVQANRVIARVKTFFAWAADDDQGYIASSPVARMKPLSKETERDRVLTDDEILWFWQGCDAIGWPFGGLFQLLLLTAQRRDEVGGVSFAELDMKQRLWTIPRERAKNNRAHEVHLSDFTVEIIEAAEAARPATEELRRSPLLFTTNGKTAVSGFSRAKERLDAEMEKLARKARGLPEDDVGLRKALKLKAGEELPRYVPEWILHDLRRTAATRMAKLNIPPHIVDKILNHVAGAIRGVAAVYNRHAYTEERKAALEAWGRYVRELMQPAGSNVTRLRAAQ